MLPITLRQVQVPNFFFPHPPALPHPGLTKIMNNIRPTPPSYTQYISANFTILQKRALSYLITSGKREPSGCNTKMESPRVRVV